MCVSRKNLELMVFVVSLLLSFNSFVESFSSNQQSQLSRFVGRTRDQKFVADFLPSNSILFSSPSPEEDDASKTGDVLTGYARKDSILEDKKNAEEKVPFFLDRTTPTLPSPILLALTIVTAIVAAGSIFNVIGGQSDNVILSLSIGTVGIPLSFFFFYGAILKGIKETEEDDEKFLRGK